MDLEAHSVPGFFSALGGVFRGVHFNSDAEGLVVVVDCDKSELHKADHDQPGADTRDCRFCQVRKIIAQARGQVRPRQGQPELKVAIGTPVPEMEAWYLAGKDPQASEAAWLAGLTDGRPPFTKQQLKKLVYGTDRPYLEKATEIAVREARRLIQKVTALEAAFPVGFGLMAREIRLWIPSGPANSSSASE